MNKKKIIINNTLLIYFHVNTEQLFYRAFLYSSTARDSKPSARYDRDQLAAGCSAIQSVNPQPLGALVLH